MNLMFLCFHPSSKAQFPEHLDSQLLAWKQSKAEIGKLSIKSQTVNISGFASHTVSVAISHPAIVVYKAARDNA